MLLKSDNEIEYVIETLLSKIYATTKLALKGKMVSKCKFQERREENYVGERFWAMPYASISIIAFTNSSIVFLTGPKICSVRNVQEIFGIECQVNLDFRTFTALQARIGVH